EITRSAANVRRSAVATSRESHRLLRLGRAAPLRSPLVRGILRHHAVCGGQVMADTRPIDSVDGLIRELKDLKLADKTQAHSRNWFRGRDLGHVLDVFALREGWGRLPGIAHRVLGKFGACEAIGEDSAWIGEKSFPHFPSRTMPDDSKRRRVA